MTEPREIQVLACHRVCDGAPPEQWLNLTAICSRCSAPVWIGKQGLLFLAARAAHVLCLYCVVQVAEDPDCAEVRLQPPLESRDN